MVHADGSEGSCLRMEEGILHLHSSISEGGLGEWQLERAVRNACHCT